MTLKQKDMSSNCGLECSLGNKRSRVPRANDRSCKVQSGHSTEPTANKEEGMYLYVKHACLCLSLFLSL